MSTNNDINKETLSDYLTNNIAGFKGPLTLEKFSGGQSNPTYLICSKSGKYVLRKKPNGKLLKSAHAVDREFKVLSALKDTDVPVVNTMHLCNDDSIIGSMFYVMEYIDGRVLWDPALPEETNATRSKIYTEMCDVLTSLHKVDVNSVGLSDYGRAGNYYERQISRWGKQYHAAETENVPAMNQLISWLNENIPEDDGLITLVHGDFRLDNMMFQHDKPNVIALVDWELSTLGHPLADLAYQCMQLRMPHDGVMQGLGGIDRELLGIPTEEEYVAHYCEKMNIKKVSNWNFYLAFSFFRFAAILQGVKKRALDGNASSDKAKRMGELVTPLAIMGAKLTTKFAS